MTVQVVFVWSLKFNFKERTEGFQINRQILNHVNGTKQVISSFFVNSLEKFIPSFVTNIRACINI